MTPDGKQPLPSKRYYDIFTMLLTQFVFGFTTAPFIILGFKDTMTVWSRVYFFVLVGTAGSFALFSRALPFRKELVKMQSSRQAASTEKDLEKIAKEEIELDLKRRESTMSTASDSSSVRRAPTLGIADDPELELDEVVREVKAEIDARRRRGSMMQGFDLKKAVQEKIKDFQKNSKGSRVIGTQK